MSEKHQIPGYRPSALGAATKVRIGDPGMEISAYSVVTIIVVGESGEEACASQLLVNPSLDRPDASPIVAMKETPENR